MSSLTNKQILLGVTGGIAAYKSADLIRRLQDRGAQVRVVMTQAAREFITPLTLQALSGNPVHLDLLDPAAEAAMGHIELGRWADLVLRSEERRVGKECRSGGVRDHHRKKEEGEWDLWCC